MPGLEDAPKLTVKAFAELLRLPAYEQLRILEEHKYPRQAPQSYRTPYYAPALRAIRAYYESGNEQDVLTTARAGLVESDSIAGAGTSSGFWTRFNAAANILANSSRRVLHGSAR